MLFGEETKIRGGHHSYGVHPSIVSEYVLYVVTQDKLTYLLTENLDKQSKFSQRDKKSVFICVCEAASVYHLACRFEAQLRLSLLFAFYRKNVCNEGSQIFLA